MQQNDKGILVEDYDRIRQYYDDVYYRNVTISRRTTAHLARLAKRVGVGEKRDVLDVGCGTGEWLLAIQSQGGTPFGVDISETAINICKQVVPKAELYCQSAERLPWDGNRFDAVTCLGSLEHFLDPVAALREMIRVAKPDAIFIILVPNAGFLTRRFGLYKGTDQVAVREEVRTLEEWEALFALVGLRVTKRWRDLHVVSLSWIFKGRWYTWAIRASQAMALLFWPLSWQYQVYYECVMKE